MQFSRKLPVALAAMALAALTSVVGAGSAAAAPEKFACTVQANFPERVVVSTDTTAVPVTLTGCYGHLRYTSSDVINPKGTVQRLIFDGVRTETLMIYPWDGPGTYRTTNAWGVTKDSKPIAWNWTQTVVKYNAWAGVAATRSGDKTTVTVAAKRFSAYQGLIAYPNRVVGIQSAPSATGPWKNIGYVTVGPVGRATKVFEAEPDQFYRSFFGETGSFVSAVSRPVQR
ncbi:hypothetical protein GIS00_09880 [Nakamurella sp. YIM 132087]|uniref:Uncharacterized protein n=1 Tax=Nakamurella alba TaxID=2665158 RepID=A0A7K1FJE7_9ACTN|nr:hypothetical protein [Nakamurella alba]MTD14255.1 hypothetical protein [Nakamurella alba]